MAAIAWVVLSMFVFAMWVLVCNERTCRQRLRMVEHVFARPDWERLSREFRSVTYEAHMFALVLLRNPMRLYSAELREAVE